MCSLGPKYSRISVVARCLGSVAAAILLLDAARAEEGVKSEIVDKIHEITINGIKLNSKVPDDLKKRSDCKKSMFPGMTWCTLIEKMDTSLGRTDFVLSYSANQDGIVKYMFSRIASRGLSAEEVKKEVLRYQEFLGPPGHALKSEGSSAAADRGELLSWGPISLDEITPAQRKKVAEGRPGGSGYMVDLLLDLKQSAAKDRPVYTISGDHGVLISTTFKKGGANSFALRLIEASAFAMDGAKRKPAGRQLEPPADDMEEAASGLVADLTAAPSPDFSIDTFGKEQAKAEKSAPVQAVADSVPVPDAQEAEMPAALPAGVAADLSREAAAIYQRHDFLAYCERIPFVEMDTSAYAGELKQMESALASAGLEVGEVRKLAATSIPEVSVVMAMPIVALGADQGLFLDRENRDAVQYACDDVRRSLTRSLDAFAPLPAAAAGVEVVTR